MVSRDTLQRATELKSQLIAFAENPYFRPALERELRHARRHGLDTSEAAFLDFLEWFIFEHRLPEGETLLETFVLKRSQDLSESDRRLLWGWRDVVLGLFLVESQDGDTFLLGNLLDDLEYQVVSNAEREHLRPLQPGVFTLTRLLPLEDAYLLSGAQQVFPREERRAVYDLARQMQLQRPDLALKRNPEKLREAWKLQEAHRQHFITYFGSDLIVLAGAGRSGRLQAFAKFVYEQMRLEVGKEPPQLAVPPSVAEVETVGLIYDGDEGLNLYPEFGLFQDAFRHRSWPEERFRQVVVGYLEETSISTLPFRRMLALHPETAAQTFANVLGRESFDRERDFERLMRKHKREHVGAVPYPATVPMGPRLQALAQSL